MTSIRKRLLLMLISGIIIVWILITSIIYLDTRKEISDIFDVHLAQSAKVLLHLVAEELYEENKEEEQDTESSALVEIEDHLSVHKHEELLAFQISIESKNFHFQSASAPNEPFSINKNGFSDSLINNTDWRVFSLSDPEEIIVIHVGEPLSVRTTLVNQIALDLVLPLLITLPALAFLIWHIIGHSLTPLMQLTESVSKRKPTKLTPIDDSEIPDEVTPLVDALNQLLVRLDDAIENERRFTADAAHELRTPLAGIKAQAQLALNTHDNETRKTGLHQVIQSVDRSTHIVEQLLAMARLDPEHSQGLQEPIDLNILTQDVMSDLSSLAMDKQIELDLHSEEKVQITGNHYMITILLRNLVDNAIRYTPDHGKVNVSLSNTDTEVTLCIEDSGPGIDKGMIDQVFNRFYRINSSQELGSGLGLSIVKRIAELHGANIILDKSPLKGLQVKIIFSA